MLSPRIRAASLILPVLFAAACRASDSVGLKTSVADVAVVSGDGQTGFVGLTLASPLVVRVSSTGKSAVSGLKVTFRVTSGYATVNPSSAVTDASGQAQTQLTLGATAGNVSVTASVEGTNLVANFVASAGNNNASYACQNGAPTVLTVGQVVTSVSGSGICLSGGNGSSAEYALIAFNSSQVPSTNLPVEVTGRGVAAPSSQSLAASLSSASLAVSPLFAPVRLVRDESFEAELRSTAIRTLSPMIPAARNWQKTQPSFGLIPSTVSVGQIITLNMNATLSQACSVPTYRGARVAAISNKAIVVADTGNPVGGFTDVEYQSIADSFDTLVDPMDTQAFGQPTDIDKNGRIVILFTRVVNSLTPANSGTYIGGFFYDRDLFPTSDTQTLKGCPTSNVGEMFYMMVPDPTGVVNGNKRDKAFVLSVSIGTLAHEYQHLINAARRMYINNADSFEQVWLNEGLSHIAEELLFYRASGLGPRQNIDPAALTAHPATTNAFFDHQGGNLDRYTLFLKQPARTSPFDSNDSLTTRGATWGLLRWMADHRTGNGDGDTWYQLVNSRKSGMTNLQGVFGTDVMAQIRDWATTVFIDDLVATDARFQESSWSWRSIYPALKNSSGAQLYERYPMTVYGLANGASVSLNLIGGGAATLQFSIAPGGQGSLDWAGAGGLPVSPLVQWTVVRTK